MKHHREGCVDLVEEQRAERAQAGRELASAREREHCGSATQDESQTGPQWLTEPVTAYNCSVAGNVNHAVSLLGWACGDERPLDDN